MLMSGVTAKFFPHASATAFLHRLESVTTTRQDDQEGVKKSVQSALSDLLTTSATHGTFSRPSTKRGLISIIKLMQFTIVRFF